MTSDLEALMKKAYANLQKNERKKKKPKARQEPTPAPPKKARYSSITVDDVDKIYADTGFKPMQDQIFFIEGDRRMHSLLLSEDGECATPIGAMVLKKKRAIEPDQETIFTRLFDEPDHCWSLGSIAQLLGYPCSYIQGFESGFNDYAEPRSGCGSDCHIGFADGQAVLEAYQERELIPETDPDPFEDEEDIAILRELARVTGYWREEWGDEPPWAGMPLVMPSKPAKIEDETNEVGSNS